MATKDTTEYLSGFGNHFATEAIAGTLPQGQNSPQKVAHGLYAEQLSGSSFTSPRHHNQRTWLYRIRPSVVQGDWESYSHPGLRGTPFEAEVPPTPTQLRWSALPESPAGTDFIDGLVTLVGNGDIFARRGCAAHWYSVTEANPRRFFYNADGEFLFVPQSGELRLRTEMGELRVAPKEIAVIPRGVRFSVEGKSKGYVGENFGIPLRLPELGPIGANGLANPRDFLSPVAAFEDKAETVELFSKFGGKLYRCELDRSPLDVVAWHGNYVPYKYDLTRFNTINTVSYDHPDPSIFTVLTSPSDTAGTANLDFVIFPPRWMVAENTFRPPYFHRNIMSEFMGLISGLYDAKATGFVPGGASLHNCMSPHGPDARTFEKATQETLAPHKLDVGLAFMFESILPFSPTKQALESPALQRDYLECWRGLKSHFSGGRHGQDRHS